MSCNKLHVSFVKLRDICDISSGQNAPQNNEDYCTQGFTFIKASDLESVINDDNENNTTKIAKSAITKYKLKQFPEQSVIFAKSGLSCKKNRIYVTKKTTFVVNHLCVLSNFSNNFLPNWIALFLKEFNVTRLIKDDSYPSIKLSDIGNIDIPVIDKAKQEEKVSEIESICSTIRNKKKQILNFDFLVKSRFIEMFENYSSLWPKTRIGGIAKCVAGATPSTSKKEFWENGTIPWLSSGEVNKYRIYETNSKITKSGYEHTSTKLVPAHTVVLAMAGQGKTRGTSAMAEISLCTNQSICSLVCNEKMNPEFLLFFLKNKYEELRAASNGAEGRGGLNLKIISTFPIYIPPIELQNRFADFVHLVDKSRFDQIQEKVRISPISDRIKSA